MPEPTAGRPGQRWRLVTLLTQLTDQLATGSEARGRTSARPREGPGRRRQSSLRSQDRQRMIGGAQVVGI